MMIQVQRWFSRPNRNRLAARILVARWLSRVARHAIEQFGDNRVYLYLIRFREVVELQSMTQNGQRERVNVFWYDVIATVE